MKIASISMVKNEADIIESFVRHTLRIVDVMYIMDHQSTDNTWMLLQKLKSEGLPLVLDRYMETAYSQSAITTDLMWRSVKDGADLVVPLDADEFIVSDVPDFTAKDCRMLLETLDMELLHAWKHILYFFDDAAEEVFPLKRKLCRWEVVDGKRAGSGGKIAGKVILSKEIINSWQMSIGMGNHYVVVKDKDAEKIYNGKTLKGIHLAHFAYRSEVQLQSKGVVGWLHTVSRYSSMTDKAFHWQKIFCQTMAEKNDLLSERKSEDRLEAVEFSAGWQEVTLQYQALARMDFQQNLISAALVLAEEVSWLRFQLKAPLVDVLVIDGGNEAKLRATVDSISCQSYEHVCVHVVGSVNELAEVLRNECQGEYIQFLYAGNIFKPDYFVWMLKPYADEECQLAVAQPVEKNIFQGTFVNEHYMLGKSALQYEYFLQNPVEEYSIAFMLFKKNIFLKMNGTDNTVFDVIDDAVGLWQLISQYIYKFGIIVADIIDVDCTINMVEADESCEESGKISEYNRALKMFRAGEYITALEVLAGIQQEDDIWLRPFLLRAYVLRGLKCLVQEMAVLQQLLDKGSSLQEPGDSDIAMIAEAWSLLGEVLVRLGECRLAVDAFLQSSVLEQDVQKKREEYSNGIFAANYCSDISDEYWQELYAGYRALLQDIEPLKLAVSADGRYNHKKIRVGYLSADIRMHPVACFLRPLLGYADKTHFQVYLYQVNNDEDGVTRQLQRMVDCTRIVAGLSDQETAEGIAADEIDILVDLSGHTKGNRLPVLAYRPAPVILSGIGYFNSLGMDTDGFLSDVYCSPVEWHPAFTEKLLRLPHTHFCYMPFGEFPPLAEVMAWERNGYITFGCFNNFSKVTDEMLAVWGKILQSVSGSHLLLKHQLFDSSEGRDWTLQRMKRLGLPIERIELRGFSADYLSEYHDVDIALDTFPYTGGLTTVEALYMGVPVVSMYGDRHGTRFGWSFLNNLGLPELAAREADGYVEKAVKLADDKELLCLLHRELRGLLKDSDLMDGEKYCREVESMYRGLIYHD